LQAAIPALIDDLFLHLVAIEGLALTPLFPSPTNHAQEREEHDAQDHRHHQGSDFSDVLHGFLLTFPLREVRRLRGSNGCTCNPASREGVLRLR